MAKMTEDLTRNQVANTVAVWDRIEERFTNRYGKEMLSDPSYIKGKEKIFQHIINQYKNKENNFAEKAELTLLKAQKRAMIRQRYPNGFTRLARNAIIGSANMALAVLKAGWLLLKVGARTGGRILNELSRPVQTRASMRAINGGMLSESVAPAYAERYGSRQPELKTVLPQTKPSPKNSQAPALNNRGQQPRRVRSTPAATKGKTIRR